MPILGIPIKLIYLKALFSLELFKWFNEHLEWETEILSLRLFFLVIIMLNIRVSERITEKGSGKMLNVVFMGETICILVKVAK